MITITSTERSTAMEMSFEVFTVVSTVLDVTHRRKIPVSEEPTASIFYARKDCSTRRRIQNIQICGCLFTLSKKFSMLLINCCYVEFEVLIAVTITSTTGLSNAAPAGTMAPATYFPVARDILSWHPILLCQL
jgi:hypothetical protein